MIEGRDIAWGASGRTGGFVVPRYKKNFSALAAQYGEDVAKSLFAQAVEAVDSVAETVDAFSLDCGFQRNGHLTPAALAPADIPRADPSDQPPVCVPLSVRRRAQMRRQTLPSRQPSPGRAPAPP